MSMRGGSPLGYDRSPVWRSRSRSRDRSRTRSPTPLSDRSRSYSPQRRNHSRSFSRDRGSRPLSARDRGRSRNSISPNRDRVGRNRPGSQSRSGSPVRSTKVVVERLTKNVTEDHLHEIFGQFGPIRDLDLPISRISGTNRGTAYILFTDELDAEAAIAHMHEAQLDGATINVSIVLPRRKFSPPPPPARRGGNFNARNPPPNSRGRRGRRLPGRFSSRARDTYRHRSYSRSRSGTPVDGRYRSRSPRSNRFWSRTPPPHRNRRTERNRQYGRDEDTGYTDSWPGGTDNGFDKGPGLNDGDRRNAFGHDARQQSRSQSSHRS